MGGFSNAIMGGAQTLIRKAIQSPLYQAGIRGWSINKDGTAEFNSLTIRGNVVVQSGSQGVFVYSGAPAAGNLIGSIAAVGGTDPYGNAYKPGFTSYNSGYSAQIYQAELSVHHSGMAADGQVYGNESGSASIGPSMVMRSPTDFGTGQHVSTVITYGQSSDGTWGDRILLTGWTDFLLNTEEPIPVRVNGQINGTDPVNGGTETWHPIPITNGWSNAGATWPAAQYRLVASPARLLEIIGRVSHAAVTGTSQLASALPSGYIPTRAGDVVCAPFGNSAAPVQAPVLSIDNTGTLSFFDLPTGTTSCAFHAFYSLDA